MECGKAWGLCALGREGVHWARIYSKARTAWGFHWPWQHWGRRPDPKPLHLTFYPYPRCQQSPPQTPFLSISCRKKLNLTLSYKPFFLHRGNVHVTSPSPLPNSDSTHPLKWSCGNRIVKLLLFKISQKAFKSLTKKLRELLGFNQCLMPFLQTFCPWTLLSGLFWKLVSLFSTQVHELGLALLWHYLLSRCGQMCYSNTSRLTRKFQRIVQHVAHTFSSKTIPKRQKCPLVKRRKKWFSTFN